MTLDGVVEDPGGAEKFKYGGWSFQFWDEDIAKFKFDELFAGSSLLLGRITYEGFAKAWPTMKDTGEFGEMMNNLPKFVVSTTLDRADWKNSTIIKNNIIKEISKLKEKPGKDILVFGSANLAQTLMQHNLIDEYNLLVYPIVLGTGKKLFKEGIDKTVLKLVKTESFKSGVVLLKYQSIKK